LPWACRRRGLALPLSPFPAAMNIFLLPSGPAALRAPLRPPRWPFGDCGQCLIHLCPRPDPVRLASSLKQGLPEIPQSHLNTPYVGVLFLPAQSKSQREKKSGVWPPGSSTPFLARGPYLGRGFPTPGPQGHLKKLTSCLSCPPLGFCNGDSSAPSSKYLLWHFIVILLGRDF
jgi:hypothetical protein